MVGRFVYDLDEERRTNLRLLLSPQNILLQGASYDVQVNIRLVTVSEAAFSTRTVSAAGES
jgi:hypothetical protein